MPSSLLQSDGGAFTHMIMVSTFTIVFLNKMYSEIYFGGQTDLPIEDITDNQSLHEALYSCKSFMERRLRIDIGMLKEMILRKRLKKVHWVDTKHQLADVATIS